MRRDEADVAHTVDPAVAEAAKHIAKRKIDEALALLAPILARDLPSLPAQFVLALAAWRMGRLDLAIERMNDCHEHWPMDGTVAEVLASLYAQSGNLVESLYMAKLATALGRIEATLAALVPDGFPSFEWAFLMIKERPLLGYARLALDAGDVAGAVAAGAQHLALFPDDREALAFHADALLRAGRASAAVEALQPVQAEIHDEPTLAAFYARSLAAVGESDIAASWYDGALAQAPADRAIAAWRVLDAAWLERDAVGCDARAEEWARRFCPEPRPRRLSAPAGKLIIGYLVAGLADPLDATAIAAVARAHDRAKVEVVAYGRGKQSSAENIQLSGAFDKWHDVGALDGPTLARFFSSDGLHVVIDAAGFAAPHGLGALARSTSVLRASWLGCPAAAPPRLFDVRIGPQSPGPTLAGRWAIGGGYPVLVPLRRVEPAPRTALQFGADATLPQLDRETVSLWSAILDKHREAQLLLRAFDVCPATVGRLVARFGPERAARIDLVDTRLPEEFYARVDVALTPRRGLSPRMAAEALGCGVPAVALAGAGAAEPYGAFLAGLGLGGLLVAADAAAYVELASALARSPAMRQGINAIGASVAERFARAIEDQAVAEMSLGAAA
jgi:tetratricopeptide (TPR) repeat protein